MSKLYHGSGDRFTKFDKEINWLTNNYDYAKYYALSLRDNGFIYTCEASLNNLFDLDKTGYRVYDLLPITKPFKVSKKFLDAIKSLNLSEDEINKLLDDVNNEWHLEANGYKMMCSTVARSIAFKKVLQAKGYKGIKAIEYCVPTSQYVDTYGLYDASSIKIESVEEIKHPLNSSLDEEKAITWGDLDYAKKTDTKDMMSGRGTGHFGTGFYFVGANGPYGLNGDKFYDYEPSRPIYEIDLDKYKLFRPKDNEEAYKLHDAMRNINNYYNDDMYNFLFSNFDANRVEDELYSVDTQAQKVYEDINDDFDDLDIDDLEDIANDLEDTSSESQDAKDKSYEKKYRELILEFIKKYGLEHYIYTNYNTLEKWLENTRIGIIEREVKDAIHEKEKYLDYVEYAINNLSNIFNVDKYKLLAMIKANSRLKSNETISTLLFKDLGYEGVDVTHLNKDAQGLSGLDNFSYGTVIYDLKPGTFKKIVDPRKQKNESLNESNGGNTFIYRGKKAWSGAVNTLDGVIEEVHSYREAKNADFNHSFYFSDTQIDKMNEGLTCFFCVYEDHDILVNPMMRFNHEGDTTLDENFLKNRIKEQIKFIDEESLNEKIVKKGNKWQVQSEKGRNLGTYNTKKEAEKRLQQVHYFKHVNEDREDYIEKFKARTQQHIDRVNKYAKKIGRSYPNHDSDKFNELFDGYSLMSKENVSDEEQKLIDDATYKHVLNNEHHCEHWCNPKDIEGFSRNNPTPHGCLDCSKMPEYALEEMCCDWCAMSEEFNNTPFEWYEKNKDTRWHFNEEQDKFILDTLYKLWDKSLHESLKEYLDRVDSYSGTDIYATDSPYQLKVLLEKGDKPYRIYYWKGDYYFCSALGDMTHNGMMQFLFDRGYADGKGFDEWSNNNYMVFIPKNFDTDKLVYDTSLGSDDYYYCRVYDIGVMFVRDLYTYRNSLFEALGEPEREIFYNEYDMQVEIIKNGKTTILDVRDINYDVSDAFTIKLEEDYASKDDILAFVEKNIGTSDKPIDGPSYILPNGKFLTIWKSKIPVSKYSSSGSATHRDVQQYLYSNGLVKDDFWSCDNPDLERLGCIRVNSGFEEYIWLPDDRPNETQWNSLLTWLDWYFRFHHKLMVGFKSYAPKTYYDSDYTTDEILKKCKEAYGRGYLTEEIVSDNYNNTIYRFTSPYQVKNFILGKDKAYRILYDSIDNVYLVGDAHETVHQAMGYSNISDFDSKWENGDLLFIIYVPKNEKSKYRLGDDDYFYSFKYDDFDIYDRCEEDEYGHVYMTFEDSDLQKALGEYREGYLTEDLTKEQEEYFKNSKIRDEKGNLLVCYHGTETPGFTEFDARKGKSQFGDYKFDNYNINYFTTNKETAIGYTEIGVERDNNVYACYLNIVNPYVVNNKTEDDMYRTWQNIKDETIRNKEIDYFKRFYNKWSSRNISDKDLDELNKDLFYFNCKFVPSEDDGTYYDLISLNDNTMYGSAHPLMYYYELSEYFDEYNYEEFRNSLVGDYEGEDKEYFRYTIDNLIRWVLLMNEEEGTNYDGIIVPEIYDIGPKGSPFMTGKTTDIITLKSSNQIKKIDNLKPTSSNNINEYVTNKKDVRKNFYNKQMSYFKQMGDMQKDLADRTTQDHEDDFDDVVDFCNGLKFPLKVYRGLLWKDKSQVDLDNLGVHWTIDKNFINRNNFKTIIVGEVNEDDVDWKNTQHTYVYYSANKTNKENEIWLKKNAKPYNVKIYDIEEFNKVEALNEEVKDNVLDALDKEFGQEELYMWSTYILPNGHFLNPDNGNLKDIQYEHCDFEDWAVEHGYKNLQDIYNNCIKMNVTYPYLSMPDKARPTPEQLSAVRKILARKDLFENGDSWGGWLDAFGDKMNKMGPNVLALFTPIGDEVFDLDVTSNEDIIKTINQAYARGGFFNESLNENKVLRLSNKATNDMINALKDYYPGIHLEELPIDQLVKDNDLLNDDDLQSYHQGEWQHKKAIDFHIDNDKINNMRASNVPFVIKKKDGRLAISDGRHRTRAAYNDGYTHVEYPTYKEE